jgi:SHS2 domain-containing protein
MKKYEQIDISGDVGLRIWGNTLEELFVNAAEGMYELMTEISGIEEKKDVSLVSDSVENLFIKWLNELVFLFDTYGFVGKKFIVNISTSGGQVLNLTPPVSLTANISGGLFNQEINESRLLVKAATYHGLSVKKVNSYWEAEVIFDI